MTSDPKPEHFAQFATTAGVLAAVAGYVNAVTITGALHVPSTHMSGTTTRLSIDLVANTGLDTFTRDVALLCAFILGAALSGAVLDSTQLRVGRRYGVLLVLESLVLTAALLVLSSAWYHLPLIAFTAGLQNALATQYSRAVVRTTHVTGILTDLGIALGKWVARRGVTAWRVILYMAIFVGFLIGGVGGAAMSIAFEQYALLLPIAITGLGGGLYWMWQYRFVRDASRQLLELGRR